MPNETLKKELTTINTQLWKDVDGKNWREHWRDIRDNLLPDRGYGLDSQSTDQERVNDGRKRRSKIMTSIAENAIANLAAGLKSFLTTPSRPWFALELDDPALNQIKAIEEWLEEITALLHRVFNASNFYDCLHNTYIEFSGFATGAMAILEDEVEAIHCRALTIGEYAIGTNAKGKVEALSREEWMTVGQMADLWGEAALSHSSQQAFNNNKKAELRKVHHLVLPNDGRVSVDPGTDLDGQPWPFTSIYWEDSKAGEPLKVGGFGTFPYLVARWNVIGSDTWGKESPGMKELANIKTLYDMSEKELIAVHKMVEPPLVSNGAVSSVNTLPGGISTGTNVTGSGMSLAPLHLINPQMEAFELVLEKRTAEIEEGFFNNLFLMVSESEGDRKTAFEVARIQEEKMSMLGPMIERLNTDALDLAIERTLGILEGQGLLPDPPVDLSGQEFGIKYVSLLAQAQKTSALRSIDSFMAFFEQAAAFNPDVVKLVDWGPTLEFYRDATGSPSLVMRDPDEVAREQAAEAQQAAAGTALEAGASLASTAKDLSSADMGGGENALQTLIGGTA